MLLRRNTSYLWRYTDLVIEKEIAPMALHRPLVRLEKEIPPMALHRQTDWLDGWIGSIPHVHVVTGPLDRLALVIDLLRRTYLLDV